MVQAARSGRQNIAEGNRAGATSGASEIHLTNVARASLDELLLDYEDFLRQRSLVRWAKDSPEALEVRRLGRRTADRTDPSDPSDRSDHDPYACWLNHADPGIVANALICLIHQANYLLDRQIAALERAVIEKGGYRERLMAARLAERQRQKGRSDPSDRSDQPPPLCPNCGQPMRLRTARQGKNAGNRFWGCSGYPECRGTRPLETGKKVRHRTDPPDRTAPTHGPKTGRKKP